MNAKNNRDKRVALLRGFLKGLAGPATLYAAAAQPAPVKVEVVKLHVSISNPVEAMRSDWVQTGADLDASIKKYSKTKSRRATSYSPA